jgi:hypothetical protein
MGQTLEAYPRSFHDRRGFRGQRRHRQVAVTHTALALERTGRAAVVREQRVVSPIGHLDGCNAVLRWSAATVLDSDRSTQAFSSAGHDNGACGRTCGWPFLYFELYSLSSVAGRATGAGVAHPLVAASQSILAYTGT